MDMHIAVILHAAVSTGNVKFLQKTAVQYGIVAQNGIRAINFLTFSPIGLANLEFTRH